MPINSLKEKFNGQIPKIDLFQADLTDRSSIDKIFAAYEDKGKVWGVIHLAVSSGAIISYRKLADESA
jgi:nucleoside-diphosphate-sugar epimerase